MVKISRFRDIGVWIHRGPGRVKSFCAYRLRKRVMARECGLNSPHPHRVRPPLCQTFAGPPARVRHQRTLSRRLFHNKKRWGIHTRDSCNDERRSDRDVSDAASLKAEHRAPARISLASPSTGERRGIYRSFAYAAGDIMCPLRRAISIMALLSSLSFCSAPTGRWPAG